MVIQLYVQLYIRCGFSTEFKQERQESTQVDESYRVFERWMLSIVNYKNLPIC